MNVASLAGGRPAALLFGGQREHSAPASESLDTFRLKFTDWRELKPRQRPAIQHRTDARHCPIADSRSLFDGDKIGLVNVNSLRCFDDLYHFEHPISLLDSLTQLNLHDRLSGVNRNGAPRCRSTRTPLTKIIHWSE